MLKKLQILAFEDPKFSQRAGQFQAQINPEKYGEELSVKFETPTSITTAGTTPKYSGQGPRSLSLDFWLDDTGVLPDSSGGGANQSNSVAGRIKAFKDVAYKYDGTIHEPRYLRVLWGALSFDCKLQRLDVEYTLFSPAGTALRALLKAVFLHFSPSDKTQLGAREKSSDLTHVRRVGVGETLPLLCDRIYGDSGLYLWVARFNGLTNFRRLSANQILQFPPKNVLTAQQEQV